MSSNGFEDQGAELDFFGLEAPVEQKEKAPPQGGAQSHADTHSIPQNDDGLEDFDDAWEVINAPPIKWQVEGCISEESFIIEYAGPGAYKSFLAVHIGGCIATGMPFYGREVQQGAVLYVPLEGKGGMSARWDAWFKHHGHDPKTVPFHRYKGLLNVGDIKPSGSVDEFIQKVRRLNEKRGIKIRFVIIDTLNRATTGFDENRSLDMGYVTTGIDRIKTELKSTVFVVHHAGKDDTRGLRGSNSLEGATDAIFFLKPDKDAKTVEVINQRQKEVEEIKPFTLKVVPVEGTDSVVLEYVGVVQSPSGSVKLGKWETKLLEVLQAHPSGLTEKDSRQFANITSETDKRGWKRALERLRNGNRAVYDDNVGKYYYNAPIRGERLEFNSENE